MHPRGVLVPNARFACTHLSERVCVDACACVVCVLWDRCISVSASVAACASARASAWAHAYLQSVLVRYSLFGAQAYEAYSN